MCYLLFQKRLLAMIVIQNNRPTVKYKWENKMDYIPSLRQGAEFYFLVN